MPSPALAASIRAVELMLVQTGRGSSPDRSTALSKVCLLYTSILLGIGRKDGTRGTARRDGGPQTAEPLPELEKVES